MPVSLQGFRVMLNAGLCCDRCTKGNPNRGRIKCLHCDQGSSAPSASNQSKSKKFIRAFMVFLIFSCSFSSRCICLISAKLTCRHHAQQHVRYLGVTTCTRSALHQVLTRGISTFWRIAGGSCDASMSPSKTTFSPLTTYRPRGSSAYCVPTITRSTAPSKTRLAN